MLFAKMLTAVTDIGHCFTSTSTAVHNLLNFVSNIKLWGMHEYWYIRFIFYQLNCKFMKPKLVGLQVILTIFTIAIIIISVTSILPAMTGDINIEIPSEDEIRWDIEGDTLYLRGDMWVNNSGYYTLENINIAVEVLGFNRTLFEDNIKVPAVEREENKKIELQLQTNLDDFSETELQELVFGDENNIDLVIISDMTANYPFSIIGFYLDYESVVEWNGLIKKMDYHEDEIEFHEISYGTAVSLPYTVETSDYLSGYSTVNLRLLNEESDEEYSSTQIDIPLGVHETNTLDFLIEDDSIEDFVFNDKDLIIHSQITFSDFDLEFDDEQRYTWHAPVEELNLFYDNAYVSSKYVGSTLFLPYQVHTRDLTGQAEVEITMWNEDESIMYSSDRQTIPLGIDYHGELSFPLDDIDTHEFIINSQELIFNIDITLIDKGIQFNTEETYYWGAPLNELEIDYVSYDPITREAEGKYSFINDSPRELKIELQIDIMDENKNTIASESLSYLEDPKYIIESNEEFEDTITIEIDDEPAYAVLTYIDQNTGMEYEREVDIDEL